MAIPTAESGQTCLLHTVVVNIQRFVTSQWRAGKYTRTIWSLLGAAYFLVWAALTLLFLEVAPLLAPFALAAGVVFVILCVRNAIRTGHGHGHDAS